MVAGAKIRIGQCLNSGSLKLRKCKGKGKVECYEEWLEVINKKFLVVEVKGLMIKDFYIGLSMPFFKKVVIYKGLKFKITEYKMFVFKQVSEFDMETYVSISGLFCEKF
jgi:hypothetical protein